MTETFNNEEEEEMKMEMAMSSRRDIYSKI